MSSMPHCKPTILTAALAVVSANTALVTSKSKLFWPLSPLDIVPSMIFTLRFLRAT